MTDLPRAKPAAWHRQQACVVAKWPAGNDAAAQKPVVAVLGTAILAAVWQLVHSPRVPCVPLPVVQPAMVVGCVVMVPTAAAMVCTGVMPVNGLPRCRGSRHSWPC